MKRRKFIKKNFGVVLASPLSLNVLLEGKVKRSQASNSVVFKAGFAKVDISSCIVDDGVFRRPLEAVCANLNYGGERIILLALDLMEMPLSENIRIQQAISDLSGIEKENIIIHTTHTHSVPWNDEKGFTITNGLPEILSECISNAIGNEKQAFMKTGNEDVGKSLSVYRLGYTGEELGFQTFWYGYKYHGDDPRPDASPLINEMKSRWQNQPSEYTTGSEPVWFDRDVDSLVQTTQFEDKDGHVLGTMVRFSAHPHITNHCNNKMYDPDYPGFVRDYISNISNAPVMFLSGTCGNTVPKDKVKFILLNEIKVAFPYMGPTWALKAEKDEDLLSETKRIGEDIAKASIKSLKKEHAEQVGHFNFNSMNVSLPLDPNLPVSNNEIKKMKDILVEELYTSSRMKAPLRELRGLANRLNWLQWSGSCGLRSLSQKERNTGKFELPVSIIKLNNTLLVFMNSEISIETTRKLRKQFPDQNLFTIGLTHGTTGYLPTAQMIDEGGYEGRSTVFSRDAEGKLCKDIGSILQNI